MEDNGKRPSSEFEAILLAPLVAEALKVNTNLHEENIYSWYTFANNIFKEFDLNIENYSNIDKSFEKVKCSIKTQFNNFTNVT
jgi:dTDP-4-dehydrorhamnose reductase